MNQKKKQNENCYENRIPIQKAVNSLCSKITTSPKCYCTRRRHPNQRQKRALREVHISTEHTAELFVYKLPQKQNQKAIAKSKEELKTFALCLVTRKFSKDTQISDNLQELGACIRCAGETQPQLSALSHYVADLLISGERQGFFLEEALPTHEQQKRKKELTADLQKKNIY